MPGPCDPEDLLDGVVFGAKYLGSTQIKSEKNPSTNARMSQAQEAVDRIKVMSQIRDALGDAHSGNCFETALPVTLRLGATLLHKVVPLCGIVVGMSSSGWEYTVTSVRLCFFQAPEGESQPMTDVDLFISTQRIKVLTADTQVCFANRSEKVGSKFLSHSFEFLLFLFWVLTTLISAFAPN